MMLNWGQEGPFERTKNVLCNRDKANQAFSLLVQIYASLPLASVGVLRTSHGFLQRLSPRH